MKIRSSSICPFAADNSPLDLQKSVWLSAFLKLPLQVVESSDSLSPETVLSTTLSGPKNGSLSAWLLQAGAREWQPPEVNATPCGFRLQVAASSHAFMQTSEYPDEKEKGPLGAASSAASAHAASPAAAAAAASAAAAAADAAAAAAADAFADAAADAANADGAADPAVASSPDGTPTATTANPTHPPCLLELLPQSSPVHRALGRYLPPPQHLTTVRW